MFTIMRTTAIVPALLFTLLASAQPEVAPLGELNTLYDGAVRFRVDREDRLIVDLFDESGHIRQDVAYIEHLAADGFRFSTEEAVVVMGCGADNPNCISKEVFRMNVIRHTGRSIVPLAAGDPGGTRAIALLSALVAGSQEAIARRDAETHARPQRRKGPRDTSP